MERELTALFGPDVLRDCWTVPNTLQARQAERVAVLADLLGNTGTPEEQRGLVKAMPSNDRVLLCRWLADKSYAANCLGRGK